MAEHLGQIAWLTCRSSVRNRLLSLLEAEGGLGGGERGARGAMSLMRQMERLYPNPYYSLERIRRSSTAHATLRPMSYASFRDAQGTGGRVLPCNDDLDDLIPATAASHGFKLVASLAAEGAGGTGRGEGGVAIHPLADSSYWLMGEESPHAGYAQLTLASLASWPLPTRDRVLLEKEIDPSVVPPFPPASSTPLLATLTYLMAHNHVSCLLRAIYAICNSHPHLRPELLRAIASAMPACTVCTVLCLACPNNNKHTTGIHAGGGI